VSSRGGCSPSDNGKLRFPGCLRSAWEGSRKAAKISRRFTVHGLRRTFNDLARRAGIDSVVIRSITGHVTESMREHYSIVGLDEKQAAIGNVLRLVAATKGGDLGGDRGLSWTARAKFANDFAFRRLRQDGKATDCKSVILRFESGRRLQNHYGFWHYALACSYDGTPDGPVRHDRTTLRNTASHR